MTPDDLRALADRLDNDDAPYYESSLMINDELSQAMAIAADYLRQQADQQAVGTLTISTFRGRAENRNRDFDYTGGLPDGSYPLYTAPAPAAPQPERQQVSEPTRSEQLRAAGFTARDNRIECDTCGKTFTAQFLPIHKCEPSGDWPESLMLRATKLHDDMGGLGQRIFTTAGAGYEKRKYVRADLMREPTEAQIEQEKANGSR